MTLTNDILTKLERLCQEATPGPWSVGVDFYDAPIHKPDDKWYSFFEEASPVGKCPFCYHGEPVAIYEKNDSTYHVHRVQNDSSDLWANRRITSEATHQEVIDTYEEEGGCLRREDADFIAAARTWLPVLVEEVKKLRGGKNSE